MSKALVNFFRRAPFNNSGRLFTTTSTQDMQEIVEAQRKLGEAVEALQKLRKSEAARLSKNGIDYAQLKGENEQLRHRLTELESIMRQKENLTINVEPEEKALLMAGKRSLRFRHEKKRAVPDERPRRIIPDLLGDCSIEERLPGQKSTSGFHLQMSTEYMSEKNSYQSGHVTLAPTARGKIRLKWMRKPKLCQIVKRPGQGQLTEIFWRVANYLNKQGLDLVVEETVLNDLGENGSKTFLSEYGVSTPVEKMSQQPIDFIVMLGGDGTMIWTSNTHQKGIPPVVAFALGSLGFLTPFKPDHCEAILEQVLNSPESFQCSVRSRSNVCVYKRSNSTSNNDFELAVSRRSLNEVVIDRGPTSTVVELEISINQKHIGTVQGDGLIISTPTGSTAYSLVAGGSLIHPALSALAVTPICCNPLSFRPFVVSDNQTIRATVPSDARNSAFVSFDGTKRIEIKPDEYAECKFSKFPMIWFCARDDNEDWLNSIEHSFRISDKRERKKISRGLL